MTRRPRLAHGLVALATIALGAHAQQTSTEPDGGPASSPPSTVGRSGVPDLGNRLASLDPDDPLAYFELAEEVGYEMPFGEGQRLARRLFVLAFALDRRRDEPVGLAGSVCLALADMSTDVNEQRWLRALAEALEGDTRDVRWAASLAASGSDRAPLNFAEALARLRAGDPREIRTLLSRLDAVTVLRDAGMKTDEARDFLAEVRDQLSRTRGRPMQREVRRTVDGDLVVELEDASGGNPGPSLSEREYLRHINVEMLLVDAHAGSWAAQLILDGGVPQRDIDPAELAPYFGIDPERSVFRLQDGRPWTEGRWMEPPAQPDDVATEPEPADPRGTEE